MMKAFLIIIIIPVLASVILNIIYEKPPTDHGKGTMFDMIANRYDFINRALALNMDIGWRKRMIAEVTSQGSLFDSSGRGRESVKVLDLATGTADVAILFAEAHKSTAIDESSKRRLDILGVDPSINMITVGREKVASKKLSDEVVLEIGDARNLRNLPANTFEAATMSFGIRNVPEKGKALCEIHRVLKKESDGKIGAKFGILEFSEPDEDSGIMGAGARLFIRYVVPVIGAVLSGAPREYMHLQNSIKEFPSPIEFVAMMESLECGEERNGRFRVDNLIQMNFGSVQLYLSTPILSNVSVH